MGEIDLAQLCERDDLGKARQGLFFATWLDKKID